MAVYNRDKKGLRSMVRKMTCWVTSSTFHMVILSQAWCHGKGIQSLSLFRIPLSYLGSWISYLVKQIHKPRLFIRSSHSKRKKKTTRGKKEKKRKRKTKQANKQTNKKEAELTHVSTFHFMRAEKSNIFSKNPNASSSWPTSK